uniref:Uncharacterized protein n=1 Tax=Mus musculus TaxID=10090 RepID=Q9D2G6_MOUSE|nr:unnamed protein product [Mus musculus]
MNSKSAGQGSAPQTWPHMLQCEVLVGKAASVDGPPFCAIVVGEVASLYTEDLVTNYHSWQRDKGSPRKTALNALKARPQAKGPTKLKPSFCICNHAVTSLVSEQKVSCLS